MVTTLGMNRINIYIDKETKKPMFILFHGLISITKQKEEDNRVLQKNMVDEEMSA